MPIEKKMQEAYLNYSLSVIIGRALPDVRDGLKPVHRRILYGAMELGLSPAKPHKKSARIVGEVLGKYHPHGDSAVYDAMVRMAQDFNQRYLLIDGHGNFGSIDGDNSAAMRYTEARLAPLALELLQNIQEETVDFMDNFDGTLTEPQVLPARVPNLLINGSQGIAVGMSTAIPPHNLGEIIDGTIYLLENPAGSIDQLFSFIKGPDFPTGGTIMGTEGIQEAYRTGKGRILLRGEARVEKGPGGKHIIITEIPYQVNKTRLLEEMDEMVKQNRLEHVAAIRDESDREGLRIVIELRNRASTRIILNNLYKHTSLQQGYRLNFLALVHRQPVVLNIKEILQHFIDFRREVITRRSTHRLKKLQEELHILQGLKLALDAIDEIISIIRRASSRKEAQDQLEKALQIDAVQAHAILKMRLERLVALERKNLLQDMKKIQQEVSVLQSLLAHTHRLDKEIKRELEEMKRNFSDKRRTRIKGGEETSLQEEDLVKKEDLVISVSYRFYVKRARDMEHLRAGKKDVITQIFSGSTLDTLLFFTRDGQVHLLPCFQLQEHHGLSLGDPLSRFLKIEQNKVVKVLLYQEEHQEDMVLMATRKAFIKCTSLGEYQASYSSIKAIQLEEGDEVVDVLVSRGQGKIFLATTRGQSICFSQEEVSPTGRNTRGCRGIRLQEGDSLLSMNQVQEGDEILVFDQQGRGRRTPRMAFKEQRRYGKGLTLFRSKYTPFRVMAAAPDRDLLLVTEEGDFVPLSVKGVDQADRQGRLYPVQELKGQNLKDVLLLPRSRELDYLD